MIKANELRLHNAVLCANEVAFITSIGELGMTAETGPGQKYSELSESDLFPIELTPEILKASGFEKEDILGLSHPLLKCRWVSQNLISKKLDRPFLRHDSSVRPPNNCTDIYYLHHLQNYFFALTGTELQIDEKIFRKAEEEYS